MKVSVVIPTLNEETGIGPTLDAIDRQAFAAMGLELEMLVIDGDSQDRTAQEAQARGARVVVEPRRGYGRAYKRGFAEATGDIIVTGDADGTYPFDTVHQQVRLLLDEGLDFATCDRYADLADGAMSGLHKLGNGVLSLTTRLLFWLKLRDSQSGMWVIRRSTLEALDIEALPEGMAFSQALKVEALRHRDLAAREVPGSLRPRIGDAVIESWSDGLGNLWALWRRRFTGRWPQ
ncbi:MAG: glycosyltransferase family 2 protein [Thermoplasmatota archaeon]